LYIVTSVVEIEDRLDENSYIHTQYSYAATGRSTSSKPNLQNIMQRSVFEIVRKSLGLYKSAFEVPDIEHFLYYKRDLSQAELRWFCFVYKIYSMAEAYEKKEDLHAKTAMRVMGKTPEEFWNMEKHEIASARTDIGKGNNFGNIYGISIKGFIDYMRLNFGVILTEEEAEHQHRVFFSMFPEIRPAHEKQKALIHRKGYSETPFGDRRDLPDLRSKNTYFRAEAERHGINQPVQGAAGVAMMFSAVIFELRKRIIGLDGRIINLIHDDTPGYMRKDQSYRFQVELREACNNPPYPEYFGFEMDMAQMLSEAEVGSNWKDVEELPDLAEEFKEKNPSVDLEDLKTPEEILLYLYDQDEKFIKYLML